MAHPLDGGMTRTRVTVSTPENAGMRREIPMPREDKSGHTEKQKRQAGHIARSERKAGKDDATAERIAWATVHKRDGGKNVDHERRRHGDHH